jgi:hypothetical protein
MDATKLQVGAPLAERVDAHFRNVGLPLHDVNGMMRHILDCLGALKVCVCVCVCVGGWVGGLVYGCMVVWMYACDYRCIGVWDASTYTTHVLTLPYPTLHLPTPSPST